MDKEIIKKAIQDLKSGKKRKFNQTFDIVFSLKGLNLKKPSDQIDFYAHLHQPTGKPLKICGLVGAELADQSKDVFDTTITVEEFEKYQKDKKLVKKLADQHDFFVAQADVMTSVAKSFGRVLGPKKKMPNPKAGCVVPPKANLTTVKDNLLRTVHVSAKTSLMIQAVVGKEDTSEDIVIENVDTLVTQVLQHLPGENNNLRSIVLKLTMSKPVKLM